MYVYSFLVWHVHIFACHSVLWSVVNGRAPQDAEETPISPGDKTTIRNQLVPAMIALSLPTDKAFRAQIAESVSVIAELDFPQKWPELIDVRFLSTKLFVYLQRPSSNWSHLFRPLTTLSRWEFSKRRTPFSIDGAQPSVPMIYTPSSTMY